MVIAKTIFTCQSCGYQAAKWLGRCPDCQQWNSFAEERMQTGRKYRAEMPMISSSSAPVKIKDIKPVKYLRTTTGIKELDRVLGGGIVAGSVILIGGEPGIGKSTLLLQVSDILSKHRKVLYASGEESIAQVKMRADRLGAVSDSLYITNATEVSLIAKNIKDLNPDIVVIDSIQVMQNSDFSQSAGTVTQVRECAGLLTVLAKESGFSLFIVGHVTKEGSIAGPKILEHMVDCVIYFEGQSHGFYRILRGVKNRFGPTNEIGIFHMRQNGLAEVENPSTIFLSSRQKEIPGSAVVPAIEGTRPILVEIQALLSTSNFSMSRQRAMGVDFNKLLLLIAVLEKRLGFNLAGYDIFVNAAGGIKIDEPACDLAVCAAIVSSFKDKPIKNDTIFIGEVGLGGEIRTVGRIQARVNEAVRMGFKRFLVPRSNVKEITNSAPVELIGVKNIREATEKGVV